MRVLHVLGSLEPGGVETWLLQVLKYIDRDRFQFHFCTFGPELGRYAIDVRRLGGKVLACPKGANIWSFRRRFQKILREGRYDGVHSHVHFFSGCVLRWAAAESVPMRIAHSHTTNDGKPETMARRGYRKVMRSWIKRYATCGLAASESCAAALFGQDWQAVGRFRVLPCGIDLRPFQESVDRYQVRRELGIPLGAPVAGHVGRFDRPKNHQFLLEIAKEVLQVQPAIHFLLVGDGPLRSQIEARAKALGISRNMHFLGIRTDVPRLMRGAMDVFVFPSLREGLPLAVIEAQAAGLCCILSETITNEARIVPEKFVSLALSKTPAEWAARTVDVLADGRQQIDSIQRFLRSDFCVERSAAALCELYAKTAGVAQRGA